MLLKIFPSDGSPLFLAQTEALRVEKIFLIPPSPLSQGLDDRPLLLSDGLDRPLKRPKRRGGFYTSSMVNCSIMKERLIQLDLLPLTYDREINALYGYIDIDTNFVERFRACLHGGGGPQVGEVTRLGRVPACPYNLSF